MPRTHLDKKSMQFWEGLETNWSNILPEQDDSLKNREQDERRLKVFASFTSDRMAKFGNTFLFLFFPCFSSFSSKEGKRDVPRWRKGWLTQFLGRSLIRTSLKISPPGQPGFLFNFYSYRFKARSEIYRANICLIFKMHPRVSKTFYNHRF